MMHYLTIHVKKFVPKEWIRTEVKGTKTIITIQSKINFEK